MDKETKISTNLVLVMGILGFIAGIALLFTESWLIGIFGATASAGIAVKAHQDRPSSKS